MSLTTRDDGNGTARELLCFLRRGTAEHRIDKVEDLLRSVPESQPDSIQRCYLDSCPVLRVVLRATKTATDQLRSRLLRYVDVLYAIVPQHPCVLRTFPWSACAFPVDEQLVPLVDELWRAGWWTCNSCQDCNSGCLSQEINLARGSEPYCWIEFFSVEYLQAFLETIHANPILGEELLGYGSSSRWHYRIHVDEHRDHQLRVTASVHFPASRIPLVCEAVRRYNEREENVCGRC